MIIFAGVETVALRGEEKNQLTVIGDCIDAVSITALLRKKLGFAQLISVTPYYDEDEDDDEMDDGEDLRYTRTTIHPTTVYPQQQPYSYQQPYYMIHDVGMNSHESCIIL